jgi:CheY-like chemotaxis protein
VTAPFGRQPQRAEQVAAGPPALLHNLPVLIVDDNATNRYILEEWLRGWRMQPSAAAGGVEAMDALWKGIAHRQAFSLVLLDVRMPGMDGLSVAAMIRKRAELSATRIILLTSGDGPDQAARISELAIDAQLLKPVSQDALLETIGRVMNAADRAAAQMDEPAEASSPVTAPLRILVAEDNEFNARHLVRVLARVGHTVRLVNNGREALEVIGVRSHESGVRDDASQTPSAWPRTTDFDLMLLDLHMPELDGFQVVQAIRQWEKTTGGHLPIIALTARTRKEDRERCLAAGMDDYLSKPVRT